MCRAGRAEGSPRPGARVRAGPDVRAVELPEELLRRRPQYVAPARRQRGHTGAGALGSPRGGVADLTWG